MKNTWIELNLPTLSENVRALRGGLNARTEIIFVVKSNAYGHGMIPIAKHAYSLGIKWFAVAHLDEGIELRQLLPDALILVVGVLDPADAPVAARNNLIPLLVSSNHAHAMSEATRNAGLKLKCQVKVDTGMGRLGIPWEEAGRVIPELASLEGLDIRGICSHFSSASPTGHGFAEIQADRFRIAVATCEEAGMRFDFKHMSNSGGILCDPAWDVDGVRPGILLYGYGGQDEHVAHHAHGRAKHGSPCRQVVTKPFLQWKTRVVQIKKVRAGFSVSYDQTYVTPAETYIGTLDVGYSDGYLRSLSNSGIVLVGGKRRPVVGRVTMNLTMIDLGRNLDVAERDEAVLLGSQGTESIWADELGKLGNTISYEILTNIRASEKKDGN